MNRGGGTHPEFGALHAFLPAVLALDGDTRRARRLEESCFRMWNVRGIEPEVLDYHSMEVKEPGYPLRPEIIESAYYLHRFTHDERYLVMGKTFFDALLAHCRTAAAYTTLKSVVTMDKSDLMPTHFLAETVEYRSPRCAPDSTLALPPVVVNTAARP